MLDVLLGLTILAAMGMPGVVLLRRLVGQRLYPLEQLALGFPLGVVLSSLVLLALSLVAGFSAGLVLVVAATAGATAVSLRRPAREGEGASRKKNQRSSRTRRADAVFTGSVRVAAVVLGAFVLRWLLLWTTAYELDSQGLWAGDVSLWADWSLHIGDTASFVWAGNLPAENIHFAGVPYAYHYLSAFTAAALVKSGVDILTALTLQSFVFSLAIAFSVYAFARRLTRDRTVAALALVLFLLGGGLGWVLTLERLDWSQPVQSLLADPWNGQWQQEENFRWMNVYFSLIEPQRPFLYGIPLALLVLTLLREVSADGRWRPWLLAGAVAGMLPFASLSAMLALAMITPFLTLLMPSRYWAGFYGVWIAVAVPQLLMQHGAGGGVLSALRLQVGWIAGPDGWLWFWARNLGLFLPTLLAAFFIRGLMPRESRRFLLAFMPIFAIANLVVFQPWDWDNTKILLFWFLGSSVLVAAAMVHWWRAWRALVARSLLVAAFVTMILSGVLTNLDQALGRERVRLLTRDEVELALRLREETPPRAVFASGLQHNHPAGTLAGRRLVLGYPGWIWSHGYDYAERERDLRFLFQSGGAARDIIDRYSIDYVVIGPNERQQMGADPEAFRRSFPSVLSTREYEVFHVGRRGRTGS